MASQNEVSLDSIEFHEIQSVDQYEATLTGTAEGEELTATYTLESAIGTDEGATVYVPGDSELEHVVIHPETYEFETDDQEIVRFAATNDDGRDLYLLYVFAEAEAEDADENAVAVDVDADADADGA